jgi:topoisomerase IA-like protein
VHHSPSLKTTNTTPQTAPTAPARSNFSSNGCDYGRPLGDDPAGDYSEQEATDADEAGGTTDGGGLVWNVRQLGRHPETDEPLAVRKGPYGLYVQAVSQRLYATDPLPNKQFGKGAAAVFAASASALRAQQHRPGSP